MISKYLRAYYVPGSGDSSTKFGQSVASLGDVDGNGVVDIAVGTPQDGTSNDGSLVLMFLTTSGVWNDYSVLSPSDLGITSSSYARLGMAVAKIDDVNSDGIQDVAVSSIGQMDYSPYPEGAVHLVSLTTDGEVLGVRSFNGSYVGAVDGSNYGRAILAVGDWRGVSPSEQDLIIGAPGYDGMGCLFLLSPGNPQSSPPRLCADEVLRSKLLQSDDLYDDDIDDDDLGSGMMFGHSLALLGSRYIAVGSPGLGDGKGGVWLLELDEVLNITGGIRVDTSSLDIHGTYPSFGSSIVQLTHSSSADDDDGGIDNDVTTIDLAVGAEKNDESYIDSGAVYILTINPINGNIVQSFKLEDFDGVPYYSGGSISNFLGKRDYFGAAVTCLGDIDSNGNIDITVGIPGYSKNLGNGRGGGWATLSLNPIMGPSEPPSPQPSHSPAPTRSPSLPPTSKPSTTYRPTHIPSSAPTAQPSFSSHPSQVPTHDPSSQPTRFSTQEPSIPIPVTTYEYSLTSSIGFTIIAWCCILSMLWTASYAFYKYIKASFMAREEALMPPPSVHTRRPQIRDIPTTVFSSTRCFANSAEGGKVEEMCSICLCEMEPTETVKELHCGHCFHSNCLDEWLRVQFVCPLCKRQPLPRGPNMGGSTNTRGPNMRLGFNVNLQHYLDDELRDDLEADRFSAGTSESSDLEEILSDIEELEEFGSAIQLQPITSLPPPPPTSEMPPPPPTTPYSYIRRPSLVCESQEQEVDGSTRDEHVSDDEGAVLEAVIVRRPNPSDTVRRPPYPVATRHTEPTTRTPHSPELRRVFSPDDEADEGPRRDQALAIQPSYELAN
eukprot:CAMPEP_0114360376 /NCGR_PEP_ID=MMETSP0101-20121206/23815_1 /TAXON_ID=38822 ORGANISM="Pteridomonas danica, Strain PT" /NCGR_SAMPLE_ID=MMETSP0101 /ASSEMBLY_ACC=CAM_ASM_000211 /LENGTH=830 /DNA_ID=CAMNT_0001504577 /DNA_START=74 /DNA_END=2564 /DNA_ORIENTATION=+